MKTASIWLAFRHRNFRCVAALICLALFLVLEIFASSGALHHRLHADSSAPGHHCVISLFAKGQLDVPLMAERWVLASLGFLFALSMFASTAMFSFDYRLAPTRGPPRS